MLTRWNAVRIGLIKTRVVGNIVDQLLEFCLKKSACSETPAST
jgi:hypothetical protein